MSNRYHFYKKKKTSDALEVSKLRTQTKLIVLD
jgi:hypothetical protein